MYSIPTIYIPICDANLWILKIYTYLFNKYWGNYKVVILGFSKPAFELPANFEFVSLAEQQIGGSNSWSKYLHDYFKSIPDKNIIFSLEDFLPVASPNLETINLILDLFNKDKSIGRFDLTWDLFTNCGFTQYSNVNGINVVSIPSSVYRISCQPAIWDREYLVKILSNTSDPWNFEVYGSEVSLGLSYKVLGIADSTFTKYPTKWTPKGAISRHHPDMFNVLGLSLYCIKRLVDIGLLLEDKMQWGQWAGRVPTFHELGGYDFNIDKMPIHPASPSNWEEWRSTYQ